MTTLGTRLFGTFLGVLTVAGCGSDNAANKNIALVTGKPGSLDPFMDSLIKGGTAKAKALGSELVVRPSSDWNPTLQTAVVDSLVAEKVGAIVIQPTSADAMVAPLQRAHDAGIQIITIDTFIGKNTYGKGGPADFPLGYVGSNNVEGGKIGCDGLAQAISGSGKVLVVSSGGQAATSVLDRAKGCRDTLAANYPQIVVVNPIDEAETLPDSATWAKGLTARYLQSDPDLKGIFTSAYSYGVGATAALLEANKQTTIKALIFDCSQEAADNIRAKKAYGCIAQKPALMGGTGVEFARNALQGITGLPTYTTTGFVVLTQDNINNPDLAQFVYGAAL